MRASIDKTTGEILAVWTDESILPEELSVIELTKEQAEAFMNKAIYETFFYSNGIINIKIVEKEFNEYEIIQLKQQLADMDYKTSKYVDGDYTEEEWQEIVKERKAIRERIRELEKIIENTYGG